MTKKNFLKMMTAGLSGSLALLPFLGFDIVQFKFTEFDSIMVLPLILGLSTILSSYVFLRFVQRRGKIGYYTGVTLLSFLLFAMFFSVSFSLGRSGVIHLDEFFAGIALAGMGAMVFWRLVLLSLGSFIASDLLIEKFVK